MGGGAREGLARWRGAYRHSMRSAQARNHADWRAGLLYLLARLWNELCGSGASGTIVFANSMTYGVMAGNWDFIRKGFPILSPEPYRSSQVYPSHTVGRVECRLDAGLGLGTANRPYIRVGRVGFSASGTIAGL